MDQTWKKVTKQIIVADSIFFSALASIFIFDSFYNIGVQILYLVPLFNSVLSLRTYFLYAFKSVNIVLAGFELWFYLCRGRRLTSILHTL